MPTTINGQTYYTPPEVAEKLNRHRATVARWCRLGLLADVIDLGEGKATRWLIPAPIIDEFTPPGDVPGSAGWSARDKPEP